MIKYIHQYRGYPNFTWDSARILDTLARVAARLLKDLVERGFLVVRGAGRGTHYVLRENAG